MLLVRSFGDNRARAGPAPLARGRSLSGWMRVRARQLGVGIEHAMLLL